MGRWNWTEFKGSEACLKWARRDLESLAIATSMTGAQRAAVQAGGNLGIFAKWLAARFEWVYTFEPDPALFAAMMHNAPESNIVRLQAAVGLDRSPVAMKCARRDTSGRAVHEGLTHVNGAGPFPTMRIDDLGLPWCDLIYLDVEGWEFFALQGAYKTIRRCRPIIAVEVNRNIAFAGQNADDLRRLIGSHGYEHACTMHSDEIYRPLPAG